jgi:serine/threonine protein kinase
MEAAGVSLSALALFVQCLEFYKLFSTAHYLDSDLWVLRTKFQIEETRLAQWGCYWGYRPRPLSPTPTEECTLNAALENAGQNVKATVELTLWQMLTLLKKYNEMASRYDTAAAANSDGRGRAVYRKMAWALGDKAKLETIVHNLNDFNNALHNLLPKKSEASLAQAMACGLTRENDGDELDLLIAATASNLQFTDAAKIARFKKAYQTWALEEERRPSNPAPLQSLSSVELDASKFQFSDRYTTAARTLASIDSRRVIVEWRSYHPDMLSGSATLQISLRNRVNHLAILLSDRTPRPAEGFNILTCMGYFDQVAQERFGFAYSIPPTVLQRMPFTLHELLTPSRMPALEQRFKMALSLARTLNLLHTSGWLHKSLRSNNIVMFQETGTNIPEFENPYVLGFEFSRPDGYHEATYHERSRVVSANQLYRHPEVRGHSPRRYQASDDIYSLGLVLLEIALWMPLTDIEGGREGREQAADNMAPLNMKKIMASVSSLPQKVGTIYKETVEYCLGNNQTNHTLTQPRSADGWNVERLHECNLFYWNVVKRLEECRA